MSEDPQTSAAGPSSRRHRTRDPLGKAAIILFSISWFLVVRGGYAFLFSETRTATSTVSALVSAAALAAGLLLAVGQVGRWLSVMVLAFLFARNLLGVFTMPHLIFAELTMATGIALALRQLFHPSTPLVLREPVFRRVAMISWPDAWAPGPFIAIGLTCWATYNAVANLMRLAGYTRGP